VAVDVDEQGADGGLAHAAAAAGALGDHDVDLADEPAVALLVAAVVLVAVGVILVVAVVILVRVVVVQEEVDVADDVVGRVVEGVAADEGGQGGGVGGQRQADDEGQLVARRAPRDLIGVLLLQREGFGGGGFLDVLEIGGTGGRTE
jgi:uncharacterized membrane protein YgcG